MLDRVVKDHEPGLGEWGRVAWFGVGGRPLDLDDPVERPVPGRDDAGEPVGFEHLVGEVPELAWGVGLGGADGDGAGEVARGVLDVDGILGRGDVDEAGEGEFLGEGDAAVSILNQAWLHSKIHSYAYMQPNTLDYRIYY